MDKRQDRNKKFIESMNELGLKNYNRYSAIDGSSMEITQDIISIFRKNTFKWRRGIIGLALSHIYLWKELFESKYEYYLILEDDIYLDKNIKEKYIELEKILIKSDYPFVFLGYTTDIDHLKKPEFVKKMKNDNLLVYPVIHKKHIWGGTFSYIIHKDTAKLWYDDIMKNGIDVPIDTYILKQQSLFCVHPILCSSHYVGGKVVTDSDIQYDHLTIFDQWDFYKGMDSPGGDLMRSKERVFTAIKEHATSLEKCVAFNTYGYLKKEIVDPSKFVKLPNMPANKNHGIYVRKDTKYVDKPEKSIIQGSDFEGWTFFKDADVDTPDIMRSNAKCFMELKNHATGMANCVAFNTYGYLKKEIKDPSKFTKLPKIPLNKVHGLYVKNSELDKLKKNNKDNNDKK